MTNWTLTYDYYDPEEEGLRESMTSLGNGYFASRGVAHWSEADGIHYPGTYVHGGYNRETTIMAGRPVLNEDLVNLPNWLVLKLRIGDDAELVDFENVEILSYRHELDIRNATLIRNLRFRDSAGRETTSESRRIVSMADMHQAAIEWTLTPENWSGRLEVITALDGRVTNSGVARYEQLEGRHLDPVSPRTSGPEVIALEVRTRQSRIYVAEAARTRIYGEDGGKIEPERDLYQMQDYIHQVLSFEVEEKKPVRVEKLVSFYTSRDHAINEPLANAGRSVVRYGTFEEAFEQHSRAWDELWDTCDMHLPSDDRVQLLVRLHIMHILQVCSPHTADLDTGAPARGLNGEAYRGHIFWDDLYIYPFLNFRLPKVTRALLLYRFRRLDEARAAAKETGYEGAMFPWQSGSDGKEETQEVHLNPNAGTWDPDLSHRQRHIGAAIFYNIWSYYQATGDQEFMLDYGAEMMLEIARFWASISHYNAGRDRYEIHGVMGPDEFHEQYPGAEDGGLNNNAYTNMMVAWISKVAGEVLELLPDKRRQSLGSRIGLSDEERGLWADMSRKMFIPFHEDTAGNPVISQFEGYENLEELDWEHYRKEYGNIQRLDRILGAEGDDPNRYQLTKQADTLMLFYLFSGDELREIFERLGYEYTPDTARHNIDYYAARTSHGSTLSFVVHAAIFADLDPEASWTWYKDALESDIGDVQGGTSQEAIHLGVMAGTLDLLQRGYMGSEIQDGVIYFAPKLLDKLDGLSFPMRFRETPIELTLKGGKLTATSQADGSGQRVAVGVGDEVQEIGAEEQHTFAL